MYACILFRQTETWHMWLIAGLFTRSVGVMDQGTLIWVALGHIDNQPILSLRVENRLSRDINTESQMRTQVSEWKVEWTMIIIVNYFYGLT
jgi:hypothetical protein